MEHKTAYEEALKQKEQDSSFHGRENDATSLKVDKSAYEATISKKDESWKGRENDAQVHGKVTVGAYEQAAKSTSTTEQWRNRENDAATVVGSLKDRLSAWNQVSSEKKTEFKGRENDAAAVIKAKGSSE